MSNVNHIGGYNVDICLCIDKTRSMQPIINTVKQNTLNLYQDIINTMEAYGKTIDQLRIRVICFGDYIADNDPMILSSFFSLPDEMDQFSSFIQNIKAEGGGDEPEDALEALAYAIKSNWCEDGWRKRHIIALFTDASAHELGHSKKASNYPRYDFPQDFGELSEMWGNSHYSGEMDYKAKRLLLFAPDLTFWNTIACEWDNTIFSTVREATGLNDISYQALLHTIVGSV